jgi:ribosomal-protein-alanine N-acetyltransferase
MSGGPATIEPMRISDLPRVLAIERRSFATPWTEDNFRHEIEDNPMAWNVVARVDGEAAGFACAYVVGDELMINDLAVDPVFRREGLAAKILRHLLDGAARRGCRRASLEVRPGNAPARALYATFGFDVVGRRRAYYADTGEDALLLSRALTPS